MAIAADAAASLALTAAAHSAKKAGELGNPDGKVLSVPAASATNAAVSAARTAATTDSSAGAVMAAAAADPSSLRNP
uniref:Putative secreted protein n=1 Tax=Anopheles marajoara TaxID=58244 RepID=A0A2M4CCP8_9DIPT